MIVVVVVVVVVVVALVSVQRMSQQIILAFKEGPSFHGLFSPTSRKQAQKRFFDSSLSRLLTEDKTTAHKKVFPDASRRTHIETLVPLPGKHKKIRRTLLHKKEKEKSFSKTGIEIERPRQEVFS